MPFATCSLPCSTRRDATDAMRLPIAVSDQNQRCSSSSLSSGRWEKRASMKKALRSSLARRRNRAGSTPSGATVVCRVLSGGERLQVAHEAAELPLRHSAQSHHRPSARARPPSARSSRAAPSPRRRGRRRGSPRRPVRRSPAAAPAERRRPQGTRQAPACRSPTAVPAQPRAPSAGTAGRPGCRARTRTGTAPRAFEGASPAGHVP